MGFGMHTQVGTCLWCRVMTQCYPTYISFSCCPLSLPVCLSLCLSVHLLPQFRLLFREYKDRPESRSPGWHHETMWKETEWTSRQAPRGQRLPGKEPAPMVPLDGD
jgi:hypothetical protein